MDKEEKFRKLVELFIRITNKQKTLEDSPRKYGTDQLLYKSEIHTIELIGSCIECNMTEMAERLGVTKGALSQVVNKLKKKKLVIKERKSDNEKEVFLKLTEAGQKAFEKHIEFHKSHSNELWGTFESLTDEQIQFIEYIFKTIDQQMTKFIENDCDCCQ